MCVLGVLLVVTIGKWRGGGTGVGGASISCTDNSLVSIDGTCTLELWLVPSTDDNLREGSLTPLFSGGSLGVWSLATPSLGMWLLATPTGGNLGVWSLIPPVPTGGGLGEGSSAIVSGQ